MFKENLLRLKREIVRANALAREANMIAVELSPYHRCPVIYDVTLQIPAANLRPAKIKVVAFFILSLRSKKKNKIKSENIREKRNSDKSKSYFRINS